MTHKKLSFLGCKKGRIGNLINDNSFVNENL